MKITKSVIACSLCFSAFGHTGCLLESLTTSSISGIIQTNVDTQPNNPNPSPTPSPSSSTGLITSINGGGTVLHAHLKFPPGLLAPTTQPAFMSALDTTGTILDLSNSTVLSTGDTTNGSVLVDLRPAVGTNLRATTNGLVGGQGNTQFPLSATQSTGASFFQMPSDGQTVSNLVPAIEGITLQMKVGGLFCPGLFNPNCNLFRASFQDLLSRMGYYTTAVYQAPDMILFAPSTVGSQYPYDAYPIYLPAQLAGLGPVVGSSGTYLVNWVGAGASAPGYYVITGGVTPSNVPVAVGAVDCLGNGKVSNCALAVPAGGGLMQAYNGLENLGTLPGAITPTGIKGGPLLSAPISANSATDSNLFMINCGQSTSVGGSLVVVNRVTSLLGTASYSGVLFNFNAPSPGSPYVFKTGKNASNVYTFLSTGAMASCP